MSEKTGVLVVAPVFSKTVTGMGMLRERYEVMIVPEFRACSYPEIIQAVVLGDQKFGVEEMALFPELKTAARNGTGYDNVDLLAAKDRGVIVTRVSGPSGETVSEYAVGLLLALSRNIASSHDMLARQGQWLKKPGIALSEMNVGIVGLGAIGRALAKKLNAMGVKGLCGWNRTMTRERVCKAIDECYIDFFSNLEMMVGYVDALVLCLALTPETKNILNRDYLSVMKKGALLVNVGRGALVDEEALPEMVESGRLGGVALDVFSVEPSPGFAPFERLRQLVGKANVILTPHMAYGTRDVVEKVGKEVADNVIAVLEGHPEKAETIAI